MRTRLGTVVALSLMATFETPTGAQIPGRAAPVASDRLLLEVTPADYPPIARRQLMVGTTSVTVHFGRQGEVTACRVASSSGYPMLDKQACSLALARGRRLPAGDRAPSVGDALVVWQLPGISADEIEMERQFRERTAVPAQSKANR